MSHDNTNTDEVSGKLGLARVVITPDRNYDNSVCYKCHLTYVNKDIIEFEQRLRRAFSGCEQQGHKKMLLTLPEGLDHIGLDSVKRIARSAAFNAKSLKNIDIVVPDHWSLNNLRLAFGFCRLKHGDRS